MDKARLAEALHLRSELGNSLWPGWGEADIPMIAYNEEYAFLVGYPDPPAGWTTVPGRSARGTEWEPVPDDAFDGETYFRQKLTSPEASPQAFSVMIGGRWASSLATYDWMRIALGEDFRSQLPPPLRGILPYRLAGRVFLAAAGGPDLYVCATLHESFHAYAGMSNPARLFDAETTYNGNKLRYPFDDDSFAEDWTGELNALADAVQADTDAEAAEWTGRFLTLRRERRGNAELDSGLIAVERGKEWEEGLAKYTELTIWRLAAETADFSPLPAMAADPGFAGYSGFAQQWIHQVEQIRRMGRDGGDTRFYYSGMAQAVLLDRLAPGWKDSILTGDIALEELLAAAIQTSSGSAIE